MKILNYITLLFSSLFWMRFNYLRRYTGYSMDENNEIIIYYTFKYKRVPGAIPAKDLLENEALLSTFNSRDAFKIGVIKTAIEFKKSNSL